jgi:predicted amidophosphoribosyltransferase
MPLTCPDCAKLIQPTWRHCPHCGQPLAVAVSPPLRPAVPLPAWCLPLAALLALVAVTLLVVLH